MDVERWPNLPELLKQRLNQPLPGRAAQSAFAPELSYGRQYGPADADAKPASVTILLYPHQGQWQLPLTLRPEHLPDHAGQVSFPGGAVDAGESSKTAALRELREELGVQAGVRILGALTTAYVFASNFVVTPWVAHTYARPAMEPCPAEVAELIEAPLADLVDPAHHGRHQVSRNGLEFIAPHFQCGAHRVWGVTAIMLGELIAVLRDVTGDERPPN